MNASLDAVIWTVTVFGGAVTSWSLVRTAGLLGARVVVMVSIDGDGGDVRVSAGVWARARAAQSQTDRHIAWSCIAQSARAREGRTFSCLIVVEAPRLVMFRRRERSVGGNP